MVEVEETAVISRGESRKGFMEEAICKDSDFRRAETQGKNIPQREAQKQWPGGWKPAHLDGSQKLHL